MSISTRVERRLLEYFFEDELKNPTSIHLSAINRTHLLVLRIVCFVYLSGIYIWALTGQASFTSNIIYLTMQGYFLTWLYFGMTIQDYILNEWGRDSALPKSPNLRYVIEIVYEIAFCAQLPITIIFWAFLFKIVLNMPNVTTQIIAVNANLHGGPLVCLVVDMIYHPFTFRTRRYSIVLLYGCIYMIVNMAYSLTVHVIYGPIDWISWLSYILMLASFAMSYFCHFIGKLIYEKYKKGKIIQRDSNRLSKNLLNHVQSFKSQQEYQVRDQKKLPQVSTSYISEIRKQWTINSVD